MITFLLTGIAGNAVPEQSRLQSVLIQSTATKLFMAIKWRIIEHIRAAALLKNIAAQNSVWAWFGIF